MKKLNIFYENESKDRWFKYDRYPRAVIRRIVRGKPKLGGHQMVAKELLHGLDILKIPYRLNDYKYIKNNPEEIVCCVTSYLLFKHKFTNPLVLGAVIFSHPSDCPDLLEQFPNIRKIVVPGNWMCDMFKEYYGDKVSVWPVGIDTKKWMPFKKKVKFDFLIYDKIRWEHQSMQESLINPVVKILEEEGYSYQFIQYGHYTHDILIEKLKQSSAVIFLCEHETQGLAYQQILSTNTPILAWERGGVWQDPSYYPHKATFAPVSAVPYWDDTCGEKFYSPADFREKLHLFSNKHKKGFYNPRKYILNNLSLEKCAQQYADIINSEQQKLDLLS